MTRLLAILFGIGFIFVGVAGFLPTFIVDGLLFGLFTPSVTANVCHLVFGVLAIMSATSNTFASGYFQLLGLLLVTAAIWGFWKHGDLYIMHVSFIDSVGQIIVGAVALLIGFANNKEES